MYIFQLPSKSGVNGKLTGYRITYTPQGGSPKTVDVGVVNTWTLTSLGKNTRYTVTVAVRNARFVGPDSVHVKKKTFEGGKFWLRKDVVKNKNYTLRQIFILLPY